MNFNSIFNFFILSLIILPEFLIGGNSYKLNNNIFSVEYDKISAGYTFYVNDENIISSEFPPSSFTVITIDNKPYYLYRESDIIKVDYDKTSVITLFRIKNIFIFQMIESIENKTLITYKIENYDTIPHIIAVCIVFDIMPEIKNYSIDNRSVILSLDNYKKSLVFSGIHDSDLQIKLGNYEDFQNFKWNSSKNKHNALAFTGTPITVLSRNLLEFSITISMNEKKPVHTDIIPKIKDIHIPVPEKKIKEPVQIKTNIKNKSKFDSIKIDKEKSLEKNDKTDIEKEKKKNKQIMDNELDFFNVDDAIDTGNNKKNETLKEKTKPDIEKKDTKIKEKNKEIKPETKEKTKKEPEKKKPEEKTDESNTKKDDDDFFDDVVD